MKIPQVAQALQRVLEEPSFGATAQRLGQQLQEEGGVPRAVELVLGAARAANAEKPTLLGHLHPEGLEDVKSGKKEVLMS